MTKQYSRRPSELLGITGAYEAWCFDEAVMEFGQAVEEFIQDEYDRTKGKKEMKQGAAENALRRMLGEEEKFRDPIEHFNRKRKAKD